MAHSAYCLILPKNVIHPNSYKKTANKKKKQETEFFFIFRGGRIVEAAPTRKALKNKECTKFKPIFSTNY